MSGKLTQIIKPAAIALAFFVMSAAASARHTVAQCIQHPDGKTAVVLNNETAYELTFFIDDMDRGDVAVAAKSPEIEIIPGEHLFGARATIQGQSFWVLVINGVTKGQLCTWTVLDTPDDRQPAEPLPGRLAGMH
jgi:hypothetical protein